MRSVRPASSAVSPRGARAGRRAHGSPAGRSVAWRASCCMRPCFTSPGPVASPSSAENPACPSIGSRSQSRCRLHRRQGHPRSRRSASDPSEMADSSEGRPRSGASPLAHACSANETSPFQQGEHARRCLLERLAAEIDGQIRPRGGLVAKRRRGAASPLHEHLEVTLATGSLAPALAAFRIGRVPGASEKNRPPAGASRRASGQPRPGSTPRGRRSLGPPGVRGSKTPEPSWGDARSSSSHATPTEVALAAEGARRLPPRAGVAILRPPTPLVQHRPELGADSRGGAAGESGAGFEPGSWRRSTRRYASGGMSPATSADEGPTQEKRDGEKSKHVDRIGVARRLLDGEVALGSAHATSARHAGWARHSGPTQPWSVESRRLRQHAAGSLDGSAHRRARLPLIGATRQAGGGGWVLEPRASPFRPVAPLAGRRRAR
jgi:hypothetical protein